MGIKDRVSALWSRNQGSELSSGITLDQVIASYDLVEVTDSGTVLVTRPGAGNGSTDEAIAQQLADINQRIAAGREPRMGELGASGSSFYNGYLREEYNPKLRGVAGLMKYDEMVRSDSVTRAALRLMKTPILSGRWFVEPASNDPRDVEIADFVNWNMFEGMTMSWPHFMQEALLKLNYGHYVFEKVFDWAEWRGERRVVWRKFAPRHPIDISEWLYDQQGGPEGIRMFGGPNSPDIRIPIDKLLVFTFDKEAGDMQGISVLRSAYKHWYFKENLYKIDAIQKERHSIGVPIIMLPPNFSNDDLRLAQEMGRNLRTNEKTHVVLPPNWEMKFAQIHALQVDALASAEHHSQMIYHNVLGQFTGAASQRHGSDRAADMRIEVWAKSVRYVADSIRDVINKWAIPELIDFNWADVEHYPKLKVRRIGDTTDWRTLSFALRNFVGSGMLIPDEMTEEWIREEMDLPARDPDTARLVATPQLPEAEEDEDEDEDDEIDTPLAGPPRQSRADNMRGQAQSPGGGNVGRDNSGTR